MNDARTLVYVAGPECDYAQAVEYGRGLMRAGAVPVFRPLGEEWLAIDQMRLESCCLVLRLPGRSAAADVAVDHAKQLGMPVYHDLAACLAALPKRAVV